jgi:nicotinamidase-related amidase
MKALIIIDMQEEYLGEKRNRKRYPYDSEWLVENINTRIDAYQRANDFVIYVKNKGKSEHASGLLAEIKRVSDLFFEKDKASCFSNGALSVYLNGKEIHEIELAGIDGNSCVRISALDGVKRGFTVSISLSCVGVSNQERFIATREDFLRKNIILRF